jgi:dTDP-4-dehydrorhamnose reductase
MTPDFVGTHHFSDAGVASWYDLAVAIAEEAAALGLLTNVPSVSPIRTDEYPVIALRPAYSVLDKSSTVQHLGVKLRHWRSALRDEIRRVANA